jgi:UDP-N-acetylglucosamine--N-acetylmuramyl-(pentapeptide) pyrophosphoryl-undecaprenol N-acetylglucosamine transferase
MSAAQPMVLMMAGGTGGHVYPALAVAQEFIDRGFRVEWMGTSRGLEARVVPAAGLTLHCLSVRGVRGKDLLHKLTGLLYLALASVQALWLMFRLSPRCVVGMGGYAAGPGGVAAWLLRKPLVIHEQNAIAGTTNRMLAPLAARVLSGFPTVFPEGVDYEVVGNPLRRELLQAAQASASREGPAAPLRLLVLGGSLGAKPINDLLPDVIRILAAESATQLQVWHQAGEAHAQLVSQSYGELLEAGVRVNAFVEDMAAAYSWADLVLCRAGALTVSELALMSCPAILVPLPHAIDDHQTANARYLSDVEGGVLQRQSELTVEGLVQLLRNYLAHPQQLSLMAQAAAGQARPEATTAVCDRCEELIHGR